MPTTAALADLLTRAAQDIGDQAEALRLLATNPNSGRFARERARELYARKDALTAELRRAAADLIKHSQETTDEPQ